MNKPSSEIFAQAQALREEKKSHKEIMEATGLSHSQMERAFMAQDIKAGVIKGGFLTQPDSVTVKAAMIAKLRLEGESWGLISVRFKEPEGRTRKAFTEATALDSKGMRIGRGGRYVADDGRFYAGSDRAKLGTELDPKLALTAQVPDPQAEAVRNLPKLVKGATKRTRKPASASK